MNMLLRHLKSNAHPREANCTICLLLYYIEIHNHQVIRSYQRYVLKNYYFSISFRGIENIIKWAEDIICDMSVVSKDSEELSNGQKWFFALVANTKNAFKWPEFGTQYQESRSLNFYDAVSFNGSEWNTFDEKTKDDIICWSQAVNLIKKEFSLQYIGFYNPW